MLKVRRKCFALLAILIMVTSFVVVPRPAHAVVPTLTTIIANPVEWIWKIVDKALKTVVAVAYKSGLQYFLNKVAYDTANYLGSGGQGGKPAFITKGWGNYLFGEGGVGDEALGEFLTTGIDVGIDVATMAGQTEECAKYCLDGKIIDLGAGPSCEDYYDPVTGQPANRNTPAEQQLVNKFLACMAKNEKIAQQNAKTSASRAKLRGELHREVTLCSPISADITAKIQLTAREILEPQKPQCTFNQIRKNLPRASVRINGMDIFHTDFRQLQMKDLPEFAAYFNPSSNDIGAVLSIVAEGYQAQTRAYKAKELERQETKGFDPVKDLVTGEIKTPATLKSEAIETALTKESYSVYKTFTGDAIADAFKVFTNTLVSKLFKRIMSGGFNPATDRSLSSYGPSSGLIGFTAGAQLAFADLMKTDFTTESAIDLLNDLSTCTPSGSGVPLQEHCVLTDNFRQAIEQKLSLHEAVSEIGSCPRCQGRLFRNLTFGFETNGTQPKWDQGIPYRSIVIMRKHRIVPVGWELAALYIGNFARERVTLGQLMEAYDDCGQSGLPLSPYCRLVDPNWILKAPLSRCYSEGPGEDNTSELQAPICDTDTNGNGFILCPPDIASPSIDRANVCANERSCIVEGGTEGCLAYGYCVKEKQVWTIGEESCPAYYASCLELKKTGSDQAVSYLLNTTYDSDVCMARLAAEGCRRYAKLRDAGGWVDSVAAADNYFLNQSALNFAEAACKEPNAVGCKDYVRVRHKDAAGHVFTYSEYDALLHSGDAYRDPAERETESVFLNGTAESCMGPSGQPDAYVGCGLYTPLDSTELQIGIPAKPTMATIDTSGNVTNWNDECPAECVGYKKYEQMATNFEAGIPITNMPPNPVAQFIPATAISCSAGDAGCDEFTNLDKVAQGGEGKEYYTTLMHCEQTGASGATTYYTWEGSDTTGFQLKVWSLISSGGAPQVTGAKQEAIARGFEGTNCKDDFDSPNPDLDCRQFIDSDLIYYYHYSSKVIVVSDDCHPMRRTLPDAGGWCAQHGGTMLGSNCVYKAIPSYSATCAPSSAGCREYRRGDGSNVQQLFTDSFESGSYDPWAPGAGTTLSISNDAAVLNNHSLKIAGGEAYRAGFSVEIGKLYNVKFWARADNATGGNITASFIDNSKAPLSSSSISQAITSSWQAYTVGPFTITGTAPAQLALTGISATSFLDNIMVQTAQVYAIKDSWYTPETCDQNPPGTTVVGAQLNCAAYRQGGTDTTYYFKKFSTLCPERFVGCEVLIDTQNSSNPAEQRFYNTTAAGRISSPASAVTVGADSLVYLIPSEDAACLSTQAGCTLLGQASVAFWNSANGVATSTFADTVVMVDPDTFSDVAGESTSLCTLEEEYCASWTGTDASKSKKTFKDPTGYTCEYKTEGTVTTWYQLGTSTPCPTATSACSNAPYRSCAAGPCPAGGACRVLGHCIGGRSKNTSTVAGTLLTYKDKNLCVSDADCMDFARPGSPGLCSNAVARCNPQVSTCTEYQDPQLPEGCARELLYGQRGCSNNLAVSCIEDSVCGDGNICVSYCDFLYVPKDKISDNLRECNGVLDPEAGCVGLHETGGTLDNIITAKHCSNALTTPCYTDNDCTAGGTCGYQQ